jgi:hypothetical protein
MARIRRPRPVPLTDRLAEEARRLPVELRDWTELGIRYWSLYQSNEILISALANSWRTLSVEELLSLDEAQLAAAEPLFETVERFRLWLTHTDAMPATLEGRLTALIDEIIPLAEVAVLALEPAAAR